MGRGVAKWKCEKSSATATKTSKAHRLAAGIVVRLTTSNVAQLWLCNFVIFLACLAVVDSNQVANQSYNCPTCLSGTRNIVRILIRGVQNFKYVDPVQLSAMDCFQEIPLFAMAIQMHCLASGEAYPNQSPQLSSFLWTCSESSCTAAASALLAPWPCTAIIGLEPA